MERVVPVGVAGGRLVLEAPGREALDASRPHLVDLGRDPPIDSRPSEEQEQEEQGEEPCRQVDREVEPPLRQGCKAAGRVERAVLDGRLEVLDAVLDGQGGRCEVQACEHHASEQRGERELAGDQTHHRSACSDEQYEDDDVTVEVRHGSPPGEGVGNVRSETILIIP